MDAEKNTINLTHQLNRVEIIKLYFHCVTMKGSYNFMRTLQL